MTTFRGRIVLGCGCLVLLAAALCLLHATGLNLRNRSQMPENSPAPSADQVSGLNSVHEIVIDRVRSAPWLTTPDSLTRFSIALVAASLIIAMYLGVVIPARVHRDLTRLRAGLAALTSNAPDIDLGDVQYGEFHDCARDLAAIARGLRKERAAWASDAFRDHLTGLWNRKPFMDTLAREVSFAVRSHRPLSLIMVDLDDFKVLNDKFGHPVGDLVLKHVANRLAGLVREGDVVARLGGEEFAITLPGADLEKAVKIARQLCNALRCDALVAGGQILRFTASFGVAELHHCRVSEPDLLFHRADAALYEAKRGGRDTVVSAPAGDLSPEPAASPLSSAPVSTTGTSGQFPDTQDVRIDRDALALMGCTFSMLQAMPDKHRVANDMIHQVSAVLQADRVVLFLLDETNACLTPMATLGTRDCDEIPAIPVPAELREWFPTGRDSKFFFQPTEGDPILIAMPDGTSPGSVVYIPLVLDDGVFGLIAAAGMSKEFHTAARRRTLLQAVSAIGSTALVNCDLYVQLEQRWTGSIEALCSAIEAQDEYKRNHSARVGPIAVEIAKLLGERDAHQLRLVHLGGFLLDVGMMSVPPRIRQKRRPLRESERLAMQDHSRIGSAVIEGTVGMHQLARIVRHHHEHYDGRGYPDRLSGDEIPLESRILAVADAYVAMTSARPYRSSMPQDAAVQEIIESSGTQFDPSVVTAFLEWYRGPASGKQPPSTTTVVLPTQLPASTT